MKKINIDEHIYLWLTALEDKDYTEADRIRDLLETKSVFCSTTKDGYEVLHCKKGTTREDLRKELNAEKRFDGWLKTIKLSADYKRIIGNGK